jgi:hypothetical protein
MKVAGWVLQTPTRPMASLTERLTMPAILFDSTVSRKSSRSFGRGITAERRRPFVPDIDDLDWAAQAFADAETDRENRHLEEQALQAAWDDQFTNAFPPGHCQMCGEPSDWLDPTHKLCGECLTDAENATITCQNRNAMGQYRVF